MARLPPNDGVAAKTSRKIRRTPAVEIVPEEGAQPQGQTERSEVPNAGTEARARRKRAPRYTGNWNDLAQRHSDPLGFDSSHDVVEMSEAAAVDARTRR